MGTSRMIAAVSLAAGLLSGWQARGDDLAPETGVFAGRGGPSPYELTLRRALLEKDGYRLCQIVVVPSGPPEWAVYLLKPKRGPATVVSRAMKAPLWGKMMMELQKGANQGTFSLDEGSQAAALAKV